VRSTEVLSGPRRRAGGGPFVEFGDGACLYGQERGEGGVYFGGW
jgi:hypothetical protein